jgi:hypothetical protein
MPLPETLRHFVRERAQNRCEYCQSHQDYTMGKLQIDHVWPLAKGGDSEADNLCLACELCNQYKWTQTHHLDPQSGQFVSLYNPRQQHWLDHFTWEEEGALIRGITPYGRATVMALRLNNALATTVRRNWIKAGWHPPQIR